MTSLEDRGAQAVADAWSAFVPDKYRLGAEIVAQNLLDHSLFHREASGWDADSFVAIKRSAAGLYAGPDPKVAHLSLLSGSPTMPLAHAVEVLRSEGYEALVVGQDSGHFLPGAPTDVPWLGGFLKGKGFERGGLAYDLERDLQSLTEVAPEPGYEFRTLVDADMLALGEFFTREFTGRWRYDVMRKVKLEGASTLFGLFQTGRCLGFALLQTEGCRAPIGGAVWQADLGPHWGSLGPIGIMSELRGAGLGTTFLNRALMELRSRDVRRAIIDWTGLVDYYGTQGFSVNRVYRAYRLNLRADPPPAG